MTGLQDISSNNLNKYAKIVVKESGIKHFYSVPKFEEWKRTGDDSLTKKPQDW